MNYYRLYHSVNEKEIGKFPQIFDAIVPTTVNDKDYIGNYLFEKIDKKIFLPKGILSQKAKKTDLLSASFMGFALKLFISSRLNEILSSANTSGVQHFKTSLVLKNKQEAEYWLLHPFLSELNFIDIENSSFGFMDAMGNTLLENVKFSSLKDFVQTYKDNQASAIKNPYPNHRPLVIYKIAFLENLEIDFFSVSPLVYGGIGFFVSEKLRDEIESVGCTGIVFKDPNQHYP